MRKENLKQDIFSRHPCVHEDSHVHTHVSLSLSHTHTHTHTHTHLERQLCGENGVILRIHSGAWELDGNDDYYFPFEPRAG